jgi:hypothetical protein
MTFLTLTLGVASGILLADLCLFFWKVFVNSLCDKVGAERIYTREL